MSVAAIDPKFLSLPEHVKVPVPNRTDSGIWYTWPNRKSRSVYRELWDCVTATTPNMLAVIYGDKLVFMDPEDEFAEVRCYVAVDSITVWKKDASEACVVFPEAVDPLSAARLLPEASTQLLSFEQDTSAEAFFDDELEEDVIITFPPPKRYTVELTITKIAKGKLRFIDTEDIL